MAALRAAAADFLSDHADLWSPIPGDLLGTTMDRYHLGPTPDLTPVVQTKVTGHTRQDHDVGTTQSASSLMAHLQAMSLAEEPAGHPCQIDRYIQSLHGSCKLVDGVGRTHRRASDHQQGPLGRLQERVGSPEASR